MSSVKKCAREECGKTVYPIEELKCLDKVWHKQCFKCTVCGMTLNMKNYKGYEKKPYCEPHYPKTVASVVTDTPEMRRLAENTKFQSQVKYHADYEKMKGTKIEIANDPELARHLQNSRIQSQAQYHGELEKKKLQDTNRPKEELINDVPPSSAEFPNENFPPIATTNYQKIPNMASSVSYQMSMSTLSNNNTVAASVVGMSQSVSYDSSPNSTSAYRNWCSVDDGDSPYTQRLASQSGTTVYSSDFGGRVPIQERQVGSIADYDPINGNWGTSGQSKLSDKIASNKAVPQQQTYSPNISKIASPAHAIGGGATPKGKVPTTKGFTVKAMYDYSAADTDEVSFLENDLIINCEKVDDGWMTGTVQRTLAWGMLPANYVEKVNQPTGLYKLH